MGDYALNLERPTHILFCELDFLYPPPTSGDGGEHPSTLRLGLMGSRKGQGQLEMVSCEQKIDNWLLTPGQPQRSYQGDLCAEKVSDNIKAYTNQDPSDG